MRSLLGIIRSGLIPYGHLTDGKYANRNLLPKKILVQSRQIETSIPTGISPQELWFDFGGDGGRLRGCDRSSRTDANP